MDQNENEFLQFAYSTLPIKQRIAIQKAYYKIVPSDYFIYICDYCHEDIAVDICHNKACGKIICVGCRNNVCIEKTGSYCPEHLQKCPSCKAYCACQKCRTYIVDRICNVCVEDYETSYVCKKCASIDEKICLYCKESINMFTLERE